MVFFGATNHIRNKYGKILLYGSLMFRKGYKGEQNQDKKQVHFDRSQQKAQQNISRFVFY